MSHIKALCIAGGLDPVSGGSTEATVSACVASQLAGVDNTVVFPVGALEGSRMELVHARFAEAGVRVRTFARLPRASPRAYRWGISPRLVVWLIRNIRRYDVVHLHGAWGPSQLSGLLCATRFARPCAMTPHETLTAFDLDGPPSRLLRLLKKTLKRVYLKNLSLLVCASELEVRDSLPHPAIPRASVIPHPLGTALKTPATKRIREQRPMVVGFLGRLHPKKNLDILIHAVHNASNEARLLVAGEGPPAYKRELEGLAADLEMTDRIEWLGFVGGDRRWAFMDSLDVLAMPSEYECFGMVAAEAMARGTTTLVSRNTGIAEIIERHDCGIVANPDIDEMAGALETLERDPDLQAHLASQSTLAAHRELSMEAYGQAIRREYETLLTPTR